MSNFRNKAREVKAAAEAERGNFEPTGAPKRFYQYWLSQTESKKGRALRVGNAKENFCHFWRVVAIWAPLMWVRRKAEAFFTHPFTIIGSLVLLVIAVVTAGLTFTEFGQALLVILALVAGVCACAFGLLSGFSLALKDDEEREEFDVPPFKVAIWGLLVFPVTLFSYLVCKLVGSGYAAHAALTFVGVGLVTILTFGIIDFGFLSVLAFVGILLGIVVAFAIIVLLLAGLANFISGRRAIRKRRAEEAEEEFLAGVFDGSVVYEEPGRISKFFTGCADFLIFIMQVVRVKKWKICPTVEIDSK